MWCSTLSHRPTWGMDGFGVHHGAVWLAAFVGGPPAASGTLCAPWRVVVHASSGTQWWPRQGACPRASKGQGPWPWQGESTGAPSTIFLLATHPPTVTPPYPPTELPPSPSARLRGLVRTPLQCMLAHLRTTSIRVSMHVRKNFPRGGVKVEKAVWSNLYLVSARSESDRAET